MKKHFIFLITAAVTLLSGCGISAVAPGSNQNMIQTNVNLSEANYRIIGTASGEDTYSYFLGIGGLKDRLPNENAIAKMYNAANLQGQQAVVNVNVTKHVKCILGIFIQVKIQATGTIIEFKS